MANSKNVTTRRTQNEHLYYDVIKKLLGPIDPIGDSQVDADRYENLLATTHLVDKLLFDINQVSRFATHSAHSIAHAGKWAQNFIQEIKES